MKPLLRACLAAGSLFFAILPAALADPPPPAQKAALDQAIHDYILSHPDVVLEALKAAQRDSDASAAAEAQKAVVARRQEIDFDPDSPVGGNPNGDVTIVEFFDYRCPYCKEVEPALDALLKEDPHLRIVYKEFPILGSASLYATRVALAARQQGKYGEFHRRMMAQKGAIDESVILAVAVAAGVDLGKAKAALSSPAVEQTIRRDYDLADALNIQGTPAFIVGDTIVPGVADIATLRGLIAAARRGG